MPPPNLLPNSQMRTHIATLDGKGQGKAGSRRGATESDRLNWGRDERKEAGEYVHKWRRKADGEYERVLSRNLCVSSKANGVCDKDINDVVSDHVIPTEWARQSTLATSWSAATQPQPGTGR